MNSHQVSPRPNSIYQIISTHARFQPERIAIRHNNGELSWQAFQSQIDRCVMQLRIEGVKRGDRIAILALNHPAFFILLIAAARLGVMVVPLSWRLAQIELAWIIEDCEPCLLFHYLQHQKLANLLAEQNGAIRCFALDPLLANPTSANADSFADEHISDEHTLLLVYTSGTTGRPKGAMLSQRAILCSARMSQHAYDIVASDHVLNVLPLFHVGGINIQPLPALLVGATLYLAERFDPQETLLAIEQHQINLINTVPTILQAMVDHPRWHSTPLKSLRSISIGSADVPIALIQRVHARGTPVVQIYGATETAPAVIYQKPEFAMQTVGAIGRTGLLCEVRLCDSGGSTVKPGETGEIWVRGDNLLEAYWRNAPATREALVNGWFRTGDLARRDEQGNYWFMDRSKHVIISGGENIYPAEVERVIREVPGVVEVAVVGMHDAYWGSVPIAVYAGALVHSSIISEHCKASLAAFKQPRHYLHVESLPRNGMGKVIVDKVRELVRNRQNVHAQPEHSAPE